MNAHRAEGTYPAVVKDIYAGRAAGITRLMTGSSTYGYSEAVTGAAAVMGRAEITFLDPLNPCWIDLLAKHPKATIFNHPVWTAMLQTCYGYESHLLAILDTNGQPVAALPVMNINSWLTGQRVVSLPFSDFCQPFSIDDASLRDLVEELKFWSHQNKRLDIQVHWPLPNMEGVYFTEPYAQHITRLDPESGLVFNRFTKSQVQRGIRKAERDGITIRMSDTWEDVRLFYALHLKTRRRQGTPIQPLRFFRLLWAQLIAQGFGFVLLAYKDSQFLAGAVFLHWNKTLTYKFGASDPAFWKLRPNHLLFWNAICWGCEHGYEVFDWGRSALDNTGLREFKLGWGSEEHILHYSVLADRPPKVSGGGKAHRVLVPLIQRSPAWVCRSVGELFYSHFG